MVAEQTSYTQAAGTFCLTITKKDTRDSTVFLGIMSSEKRLADQTLGDSLLAFYPTCFIPFCLFVCLLKIVYHVKDGEKTENSIKNH